MPQQSLGVVRAGTSFSPPEGRPSHSTLSVSQSLPPSYSHSLTLLLSFSLSLTLSAESWL